MADLPDITEDEYDALKDLDPRTEDVKTEFAIVYVKRGKPFAEGPFAERYMAEARAREIPWRNCIAERMVHTDFGFWTPSDPRGHVD